MTSIDNIYNGLYEYLRDSYKDQAADEGVEWTQAHDEFIGPHADGLYNQVIQVVDMYMMHFAEPLPKFEGAEEQV